MNAKPHALTLRSLQFNDHPPRRASGLLEQRDATERRQRGPQWMVLGRRPLIATVTPSEKRSLESTVIVTFVDTAGVGAIRLHATSRVHFRRERNACIPYHGNTDG